MSDITITLDQRAEDVHRLTLTTGIRDRFGREVGGVAFIHRYGSVWQFSVRSAREGSVYGAIRPSHEVATLEMAAKVARGKLLQMARRIQSVAAGQSDGVYRTASDLRRTKSVTR